MLIPKSSEYIPKKIKGFRHSDEGSVLKWVSVFLLWCASHKKVNCEYFGLVNLKTWDMLLFYIFLENVLTNIGQIPMKSLQWACAVLKKTKNGPMVIQASSHRRWYRPLLTVILFEKSFSVFAICKQAQYKKLQVVKCQYFVLALLFFCYKGFKCVKLVAIDFLRFDVRGWKWKFWVDYF